MQIPPAIVSYRAETGVSDAILSRRSLRTFLPQAVDRQQVENILSIAARAPSGTNMQPWKAYVVQGERRQQLCDAVCHAFDHQRDQHQSEINYYPDKWFEPYIGRRRKVGWDLYGLLGIGKKEREKMHAQQRRNFHFFGASVGIIFTVHRDLATGSWLDYGMFLQNIMLLARERGLHTCAQAAWCDFHHPIREVLSIGDEQTVVCGMALGYADPSAVENSLDTERSELQQWVNFFE